MMIHVLLVLLAHRILMRRGPEHLQHDAASARQRASGITRIDAGLPIGVNVSPLTIPIVAV
jgi:hypothetical protein